MPFFKFLLLNFGQWAPSFVLLLSQRWGKQKSCSADGTSPIRLHLTRRCLSGHLWLCMCEWEREIERVPGFLCRSVDLLVSSLLFCYFLWGRRLLLTAFVSWMKRAQFIMSPCGTPSSSGSPGKPTRSKVRRKVRLWLWKRDRERPKERERRAEM